MGTGGSPFLFNASVSGLTLYLDSFAVIELAKKDASRRQRLVTLFQSGSLELLFSVTNAAELSALKGRSLVLVKAFLDEIGPHWIPAELNPFLVVERELKGEKLPFLSEQIMKDYFTQRAQSYKPQSGAVIDLSCDFFRLAAC